MPRRHSWFAALSKIVVVIGFLLMIPSLIGQTGIVITPDVINMVVGETRPLQAFQSDGTVATDLTWSSSDITVATLSTDDPPVITALATGHVTITAGDASVDLTVYAGPLLPTGAVKWATLGDGSGVYNIIAAIPSDTGVADVFAFDNSGNVQAVKVIGGAERS